MRRFFLAAALLACAALLTTTTAVRAQDAPGAANDINGDGAGDLVVGVPLEDVGARVNAGKVNVLFSNGTRLIKSNDVALSRTGPLPGTAHARDLFGSSVELAHVDGDQYADLIVGSSGETVGGAVKAGTFMVIPGSASGPVVEAATAYNQGDFLPGEAEAGDFFGYTTESGDFDGDGYADVVVTAPFEDVDGAIDAGSVTVIPGGPNGLDPTGARVFTQTDLSRSRAEPGDFFGWSVAADDFDGDGHDDLAVGAPGEDRGAITDAGAVNVLYGSPEGLTSARSRLFDQSGPIKNRPETEDLFGFSLATSDLNCDRIADLAVGVPNETLGANNVIAGLVNIILGSDSGLVTAGNTRLVQGSNRVAGSRDFNQFGRALAGGRFDAGRCGDLAVGAPTTGIGGTGVTLCTEDPGCAHQAGATVLVYGSKRWPRIGGTGFFSQRGRVPGTAEENDFFGRTLAALDINGDGIDELIVGVPLEDIRGRANAGQVIVLPGTRDGITGRKSYGLSQAGRVADRPEANDRFGASLTDSIS